MRPIRVVLPLDQDGLVADVVPDCVRKAMSLARVGASRSGLCLDRFEEFVLVNSAVKLPKHFLALVVI